MIEPQAAPTRRIEHFEPHDIVVEVAGADTAESIQPTAESGQEGTRVVRMEKRSGSSSGAACAFTYDIESGSTRIDCDSARTSWMSRNDDCRRLHEPQEQIRPPGARRILTDVSDDRVSSPIPQAENPARALPRVHDGSPGIARGAPGIRTDHARLCSFDNASQPGRGFPLHPFEQTVPPPE